MNKPAHVQTKREIKELLETVAVEPRKRFGQHFLIDGNLMRRLVDRAKLVPTDLVLEVGGGTGGLTDLLIERVAGVVCIEVDRDLHALLARRFSKASCLTLICGDVLETKHRLHPEVAAQIREWGAGPAASVKLVANLPYQIATPLVMNLLVDFPQVRMLCFMVQMEVAERFTANTGCRAYGPISIVAQSLCRIETIARVPRQAFWPQPTVDSRILRLVVTETPFANHAEVGRFATLLRGLFDHRRKTLRASLKYIVDGETQERIAARFDVTRRPQSLDVTEWLELYRIVACTLKVEGGTSSPPDLWL